VTFIYPCLTDSAALTPTGAAWQMPLAALQDRRLSKVARSANTALANTALNADLGSLQTIGGIAIVRHNLSLSATWRARVSANADMSDALYDSGWLEGWGRIYAFGSLPWGSPNWWDGKMLESARKSYPGMLVDLIPELVVGRYLRIEIADEANADGYVELGRLYVGGLWSPQINASYGASTQWNTATTSDQAIDGTEYFDRREGLRSSSFNIDHLTNAEAFGQLFEMQRTLGTDKQVLFMMDPDDSENFLRTSYLGTFKSLNPISYPSWNSFAAGFEIKESR
jgi:hypothetical protein